MDALLLQLFEFYEIVVFTSETAINGNSLLTALDPNQLILYKLYRNSTKYVDGVHVKVCVGGAPTCVGGLLRVCGGSYVCVGAPTCVCGGSYVVNYHNLELGKYMLISSITD